MMHSQVLVCYFVGKKAKRRILKQRRQKNKTRQTFQKISYALISTSTCVLAKRVRNVRFSENLTYVAFMLPSF